jgi:uncharacterized membrane protein SpoIIM required for sporulation
MRSEIHDTREYNSIYIRIVVVVVLLIIVLSLTCSIISLVTCAKHAYKYNLQFTNKLDPKNITLKNSFTKFTNF